MTTQSTMEVQLWVDRDGVATLEFRGTESDLFPLPLKLLQRLDELLGQVEGMVATGEVCLLLLETSGASRFSGYDLDELVDQPTSAIAAWSRDAQSILRRLELLPIPSVCGILGEWSGGMAELALACSYRVAAAHPLTRIAFPHGRIGLVPAWGGTVRLPRLVGLQSAIQLISDGRHVGADEARELGLVDHLADSAGFSSGVRQFGLLRLEQGRAGQRRRRPLRLRFLEETAPGRRFLSIRAAKRHALSSDPSAAVGAAIALMREGVAIPLDQAFEREAATAAELLSNPEVRARIHSQRLLGEFDASARNHVPPPDAVAILGVGRTASDLAVGFARAGIPVTIKGNDRAGIRTALRRASDLIEHQQRVGVISRSQGADEVALLAGGTRYGGFGTVAMVLTTDEEPDPLIEALVELDRHVTEACIVALCSSDPSAVLGSERLPRADRTIGWIESLPIGAYPLVELLAGSRTSAETISTARTVGHARSLRPVMVRSAPTPSERLFGCLLAEGSRLLESGVSPQLADRALLDFGFLLGVFQRADALGPERVARLHATLADRCGKRMELAPAYAALLRDGEMVYRYREGKAAGVNPRLRSAELRAPGIAATLVLQRFLFRLTDEAARILEDRVVGTPEELEVISILGLGFPRRRGGLLFHTERLDLRAAVRELEGEAERNSTALRPSERLRERAAAGGRLWSP